MIITFCGHSDFNKCEEYEKQMLELLDRLIKNEPVTFYLGNYGGFDDFAFMCCRRYKETHPNCTLIFVTPYRDQKYLDHHLPVGNSYDEILYPDIEKRPPKLAILYRNMYMVEKSDVVIAYVKFSYGGAYKTYAHAQKKGKTVYNLFLQGNENK